MNSSSISHFSPSSGSTAKAPAVSGTPIQFGQDVPDEFTLQLNEKEEFTSKQRLNGAFKSAVKAIFNPRSIFIDTLIAVAITIATAWLPGSQLLTIPTFLAISAAWRAVQGGIEGYQHPKGKQDTKSPKLFMFPISN